MKSQSFVEERFKVKELGIADLDLTVELIEPRLEMAALDMSMLIQPMAALLPDRCKVLPDWYGWFRWFWGC